MSGWDPEEEPRRPRGPGTSSRNQASSHQRPIDMVDKPVDHGVGDDLFAEDLASGRAAY
jgi:hypothetical protein